MLAVVIVMYLCVSALFVFIMLRKLGAKVLRVTINLYPGWQRVAIYLVMWLVAFPEYIFDYVTSLIRVWLFE